KIIKRGKQLAFRKVAGRAKDDHYTRVGGFLCFSHLISRYQVYHEVPARVRSFRRRPFRGRNRKGAAFREESIVLFHFPASIRSRPLVSRPVQRKSRYHPVRRCPVRTPHARAGTKGHP